MRMKVTGVGQAALRPSCSYSNQRYSFRYFKGCMQSRLCNFVIHVIMLLLLIFSLLSKNESRLVKSPSCLSVCPPLITFEALRRFS
jgi:hypothetical protein